MIWIVPILIFFARIIDVSIGTIRIILVGKGYRAISAILGFVEVLIWVIAIGQIMQNLDSWIHYIAYASGFAAGTYIGIVIEQKLSIGKVVLRIITRRDATELLNVLCEKEYSLTSFDAMGRFEEVKIIYMVIRRRQIKELITLINKHNPKAFYTIEDVRFVNETFATNPTHPGFLKRISGRRKLGVRK